MGYTQKQHTKEWYMEIFIGDLKKDSWFWGMCCDRYAAGGGT